MNELHPDRRSSRDWAYVKDSIIESYIPVYISAMFKRKKIPILIDAFAGPGKYEDGSKGSPLIMIDSVFEALKRQKRESLFKNVIFFFSEIDSQWFESLKKSVDEKWKETGNTVGARRPFVKKIEAEYLINELISFLREKRAPVAPFLYLDPWGIKGIERDMLADFLSLREEGMEAEILFRFPPREVFRFYKNPMFNKKWLEEKVGKLNLNDIQNSKSASEREKILRRYLAVFQRFYSQRNFYHVAIEIPGSPPYYMVFFTEHERGCFEMGIAMTQALKKYLSLKPQEVITISMVLSKFSVSQEDCLLILRTLKKLTSGKWNSVTVEQLIAAIYKETVFPKFFRKPKDAPDIRTWQDALKDLRNQGKVIFLDGKVSEPHCRICLAEQCSCTL